MSDLMSCFHPLNEDYKVISCVYEIVSASRCAIHKIVIDALRKLSKVDREPEARERAQVVLGEMSGGWAA